MRASILRQSRFKESTPARAKDFYESFFRAVSRLHHGATHCVIALPARFGKGLPQRAKAAGRGLPGTGLAKHFLNSKFGSLTQKSGQ